MFSQIYWGIIRVKVFDLTFSKVFNNRITYILRAFDVYFGLENLFQAFGKLGKLEYLNLDLAE